MGTFHMLNCIEQCHDNLVDTFNGAITRDVLRLAWPSILLQSARDRVATAA